MWEPVWGIDAWVSLTAAAMQTERIRLGTLLTPLSRMRPWELAGKAATLDNLSNGRVIISVGLLLLSARGATQAQRGGLKRAGKCLEMHKVCKPFAGASSRGRRA